MRNFVHPSRWDRVKQSLGVHFLLLLVAGFFGYEAFLILRQARFVRQDIGQEEQKIQELQKAKARLEAAIAELQTPQGVEREAKARLNLKNPGEEVVVVVPDQRSEKETPSIPWRQRIYDWLWGLYGSSTEAKLP